MKRLILLLLPLAFDAAACTRDEAFDRMMALNQYGMRLQAALPDPLKDPGGYEARYRRVMDFHTRLAAVGQVLAAERYDEACATYDALASEYGVDYAAQNVRPLSAYEAGKPADAKGCDVTEAARRNVALVQKFQATNPDREAWQRFGDDTEAAGLAMQQDPAEACAILDRVAKKYGL